MKCVIALLMLFSTVASAANWLYVATNGTPATGNNISYDKASVINDGDTRKVWLKFHGVGTNNAKKSDLPSSCGLCVVTSGSTGY